MDREDCDCELCQVQYDDEFDDDFDEFESEQPYDHTAINYLCLVGPMETLQTALDEMLGDAIAGRKAH